MAAKRWSRLVKNQIALLAWLSRLAVIGAADSGSASRWSITKDELSKACQNFCLRSSALPSLYCMVEPFGDFGCGV